MEFPLFPKSSAKSPSYLRGGGSSRRRWEHADLPSEGGSQSEGWGGLNWPGMLEAGSRGICQGVMELPGSGRGRLWCWAGRARGEK